MPESMKSRFNRRLMNNKLSEEIYEGRRLTPEEALDLFSWDLIDLGRAADFRMRLAHPADTVGFVIDRIINFTNVCRAGCAFCAFHARAGLIEPYELSIDEIFEKIAALAEAGGTQVMLQGGLHPDYGLERYTDLVEKVKGRFPAVWLHSFSPAEVVHVAEKENMSINEVVGALKKAGLDSMPGASDMLVNRIRKIVSPKKLTVAQWREVMISLAEHGLPSSATMTYGMGETEAEKIEHLVVVREVADQTSNIQAFIPWSFSPARTRLEHIIPATGVDYLRVVAIARIFLDNIRYIQAGWLTEGLRLAQIALSFGANDMGGVLAEEVVVKSTGIQTRTTREEMVELIKNAGKKPVQRDSLQTPGQPEDEDGLQNPPEGELGEALPGCEHRDKGDRRHIHKGRDQGYAKDHHTRIDPFGRDRQHPAHHVFPERPAGRDQPRRQKQMDDQRRVEPAVDFLAVALPNGEGKVTGSASRHHAAEKTQKDNQRPDHVKQPVIGHAQSVQYPPAAEKRQADGQQGTGVGGGGVKSYPGRSLQWASLRAMPAGNGPKTIHRRGDTDNLESERPGG